jgi:hypothetical protein
MAGTKEMYDFKTRRRIAASGRDGIRNVNGRNTKCRTLITTVRFTSPSPERTANQMGAFFARTNNRFRSV